MKENSSAPEDDINARIALRVRSLRAAGDLSLEALAVRSDVSRSMLSLIERGESSPTAVVLEKIATGLGVPLATLFEDAQAPASPVARAADRSTWRDPASGYIRRNISPPNFPSPIQVVDVELPAGATVAYEMPRSAPFHQQVWVREGSLEVTLGDVTHALAADDCLAMLLDVPITYRNRTRKAVRYHVVIAAPLHRG